MANRPKSVYLTERTMSALRPDDSLSARINQIVDRYLDVVARDRNRVRGRYDPDAWQRLADELHRRGGGAHTAAQDRELLHGADRHLHPALEPLTGGDLIVLIELLENERWGDPPGTHT